MSYSTSVRISIGLTALEFTFGSGYVADQCSVQLRQPLLVSGAEARTFLTERLLPLLSPFERSLVWLTLHHHDDEYSEEDKIAYANAYNAIHLKVEKFD